MKLRYSAFRDSIDIDALEDALGFQSIRTDGKGNDIGYCLFPENHKHGDTTGKFAIHREKKVYNCYVCGGGDLLSLVMELRHLDVDDAVEWLYQFAQGDHRTHDEFADWLVEQLADEEKSVTRLPYFNERVLKRFDGPLDYFILDRGYSPAIVDRYGLRYSSAIHKSAPVKRNRRTGELEKIDEDYIGAAAIWPHYWHGRLVGWQHRWLDARPKWLGKWTNTTDFPKEETIFNYERALQANCPVVVIESAATALFCETYDVPAVAYFGSKPTPVQLRLLRRLNHGVILAKDNDSNKAGDQILGAVPYLERFIPVYLTDPVPLGDGADLGDFAQTADPEANLKEHLDQHTHEVGI